jgi:hypothetical protein
MKVLKGIGTWIRRWWYHYLLSNPVSENTPLPKPEVPMITDVESEYEVITYQGQRINLHKSQIKQFEKLNRAHKREIKKNWGGDERKGRIKFIEVNGKTICVKNRDYDSRADRKA